MGLDIPRDLLNEEEPLRAPTNLTVGQAWWQRRDEKIPFLEDVASRATWLCMALVKFHGSLWADVTGTSQRPNICVFVPSKGFGEFGQRLPMLMGFFIQRKLPLPGKMSSFSFILHRPPLVAWK